ncbi:hypothetical protein SAMN04487965_0084 [Microbulbifer donghaiensis]|uniref:Uncharacterized protein n=1 Tax=Microbulbifer donghaiensis TaxID=494016 RepID=A0A1M4U7L4_9GAMM|nr:hypothetical protein SAMN04487965_0084 [Microbulbifer donghaiensis]
MMVLTIGCAQHSDSSEIVINEVTGSGTDENKTEFCSDFTVSLESAEDFFRKAKPISLKQLHDEHDYLPCYSYGTASVGSKSCTWEIRAGNTAELKCGTTVQLFACDDCLPPQ